MSQGSPPGIDLSGLPPEIRRKVEVGLAKLSPEMRKQWEQQGSPLLAKLVSGLATSARGHTKPPPIPGLPQVPGWKQPASASTGSHVPSHTHIPATVVTRSKPHGHYNDTIRPGDRRALGSWPVWVFVAAVAATILEF